MHLLKEKLHSLGVSISWSLSGSCRRHLLRKTERDQRLAQLTDELALKSALLEQAEANAAETTKCAGLKLREHADRLHVQTSLV
jgi:hypothetical protein